MRLTLPTVLVVAVAAGCSVGRSAAPPSPYCRGGDPLAGVYHPGRLRVRSRCRVAAGVVDKVKFEDYDGDVHIDLRPDDPDLLSRGNDQVGGDLVVELIPQDRSRVAVPEPGARITVVGPWVHDEAHDWMEIHPAWWISAGRIQPATAAQLRRVQLLLNGVEAAAAEDDA